MCVYPFGGLVEGDHVRNNLLPCWFDQWGSNVGRHQASDPQWASPPCALGGFRLRQTNSACGEEFPARSDSAHISPQHDQGEGSNDPRVR